MSQVEMETFLEGIRQQMDAEGVVLPSELWAEFVEAMSHPDAAERALEIFEREAGSVQQGDAAPDFALKPLRGYARAKPVRLSDHAGKRPVALIFGSYT